MRIRTASCQKIEKFQSRKRKWSRLNYTDLLLHRKSSCHRESHSMKVDSLRFSGRSSDDLALSHRKILAAFHRMAFRLFLICQRSTIYIRPIQAGFCIRVLTECFVYRSCIAISGKCYEAPGHHCSLFLKKGSPVFLLRMNWLFDCLEILNALDLASSETLT